MAPRAPQPESHRGTSLAVYNRDEKASAPRLKTMSRTAVEPPASMGTEPTPENRESIGIVESACWLATMINSSQQIACAMYRAEDARDFEGQLEIIGVLTCAAAHNHPSGGVRVQIPLTAKL